MKAERKTLQRIRHKSSFVPLGTQAVGVCEDRSPDLRIAQPPSHKRPTGDTLAVVHFGPPRVAEKPGWFSASADQTGRVAEALTVAGQWRNFTAFPSILAITVVDCAVHRRTAGAS
jgi:hypothetical protein